MKIIMNMDLYNTELVKQINTEQEVGVSYTLPDYCQDIFKVIKSKVSTRILSYKIEGSKLEIDGINILTVLYLGEENNKINQLEQRLIFTKNVDLQGEFSDSYVKIEAKCSYVNCKVQNSRKIDVAGAVGLDVKIFANKVLEVNTDWSDMQIKSKEVEACGGILYTYKQFSMKEEVELGAGNAPIQDIISYEAIARSGSYKLLANKAICKGELVLNTVYSSSKNPLKPEFATHTIPISRIVDFDDVDEDYVLDFNFDVTKYDIDLHVDEDGECRVFTADVGLRISCEAVKNSKLEIVEDCYSTNYEIDVKKENVKLEKLEKQLDETIMLTNQITFSDVSMGEICFVDGELINVVCSSDVVTYGLKLSLLMSQSDGTPCILEEVFKGEYSLNEVLSQLDDVEDIRTNINMSVKSISYRMLNSSVCEIRSEVLVCGMVFTNVMTQVITSVEIDENAPKQELGDSCIKVYFTQEGETLWDIAKRYNKTVVEVVEYNCDNSAEEDINIDNLLNQKIKTGKAILIPTM